MQIALTIAGSDSGGGAGIQADLKTFQHFGVFGTSVITAITAQNTLGVSAVHPVPIGVVEAQLAALAADLPPAAVKTGMLATAPLVTAIAAALGRGGFGPYVLDPVMVATSGDRLLDADAEREVRNRLVPLAAVVTPNLDEAAILTGVAVTDVASMERAGHALLQLGARAALIKGGHLPGETLTDVLVTRTGSRHFVHRRIPTRSTHGTGCTLSAAITAGLAIRHGAGGLPDIETVVGEALDYLHRAIATAPGLGHGHGPVNHAAS
ncbi:MAG: bifunctional hydroxymethylpyrimidine kinase/phosphomethylpyrimidine kinase [Gemmatimonadales bacterium]|nr:bifunctional hydroxymethylpyrimidine kinase/phosphomethylpyrimidine kinase [Gemmatimonadales bacterium]